MFPELAGDMRGAVPMDEQRLHPEGSACLGAWSDIQFRSRLDGDGAPAAATPQATTDSYLNTDFFRPGSARQTLGGRALASVKLWTNREARSTRAVMQAQPYP